MHVCTVHAHMCSMCMYVWNACKILYMHCLAICLSVMSFWNSYKALEDCYLTLEINLSLNVWLLWIKNFNCNVYPLYVSVSVSYV